MAAIPRPEKWSLFFGVVLVFAANIIAVEIGMAPESASLSSGICVAGATS